MISTLIVDDSVAELDVIRYLAQKYCLPLDIHSESDGEAALYYIREHRVELLITDIRMPFMDGLELSRKALAVEPGLKIVISSAYQDFTYAKTAISLGVEEYLLKPIRPEEFTALIRRIAEKIEKEKKLQKANVFLNRLKELKTLPDEEEPFVSVPKEMYQTVRTLRDTLLQDPAQTESGQRDGTGDKVSFVCEYISEHYKEEISLESLARAAFLSPEYLSRIFKKETGMNLSRYIKTVRLNEARRLLETTNQKISAVAQAVGYQNSDYFIRSFTAEFGLSPEKYRRQCRR